MQSAGARLFIWAATAGAVITAAARAAEDAAPPSRQLRAMWVTTEALYDREEVERLVATAAAYDFDALFVQVRRAGDAYYRSAGEPRSRKLEGQGEDFDPLAETITLAGLFDVAVYAWLNVNYVWPGPAAPPMKEHVANRHSQWLAVGRDGRRLTRYSKREMARADTEGWYIDPGEKAFADYFAGVAAEVVRDYAVAGVHLDFIRYPNYRFGYGKRIRARYLQERGGQDPILLGYHKLGDDIFRPAAGFDGLATRWFDLQTLDWLDWRATQVTRVVAATRRAVKEVRPAADVSAAVWANPEYAYRYVGQDWLAWLEDGLVDTLVPMTYWGDAAKLTSLAARVAPRRRGGRLFLGVGTFNHDPEYTAATVAGLAAAPIDGVVLFDYGSCWQKPDVLPLLAERSPREAPLYPR